MSENCIFEDKTDKNFQVTNPPFLEAPVPYCPVNMEVLVPPLTVSTVNKLQVAVAFKTNYNFHCSFFLFWIHLSRKLHATLRPQQLDDFSKPRS